MIKVFISASIQDKKIIDLIQNTLQNIGIETISPLYFPAATQPIEEEIKNAIQTSDIIFLILTPYTLSPDSVGNINYEIGFAQSINKPVYVFVERGTNIDVNMKATAYFTFDRINMVELKERIKVVTEQADMIKMEEEKKQALIAAGIMVGVPLFIWLLKNMKK
ncbi:hypothetical protein BEH94_12080 [Candidatus Altiarchaeales archaeon WOR_SM1_SCG]|nr:hypothetical protein BEH94_12080 [Candidatus Altiarchaeales archaeon WOR_SM1_SCG]